MARILRNPFEKSTKDLSTGSLFEMEVLSHLSDHLSSKYIVIPNVILDNSRDPLSALGARTRREVDHLIVGPNGLFLLEVKKYDGSVDGLLWGFWNLTRSEQNNVPSLTPDTRRSDRKEADALEERLYRVVAILKKFINRTNRKSLIPYTKVRGIFVFPQNTILKFLAKDGSPVNATADVRAVTLDNLVDSIEKDSLLHSVAPLSQADILKLSEVMDKGISVNPASTTTRVIGHYQLEQEVYRDQAPNGLNFTVYLVKDLNTGINHQGKYYDWSPMNTRVQAVWVEQVQRHKKALAVLSTDRRIHRIITAIEDAENFGYLVVESLINSPTLAQLLTNTEELKKVNLDQLMLNLALGVRSVHRSRFVHRELSPKSVFVQVAENDVVITNFELAKMLGESGGPTSQTIPTVITRDVPPNAYRAPEIAIKPHDVDERADIYSWGSVYFRLVTGHQFRNDSKSFERLAALPGLRDSLRELIEKCLEADPVDRPTNIEDVISALRRS